MRGDVELMVVMDVVELLVVSEASALSFLFPDPRVL